MALFPGPQWTPLQIADGLMCNRPLPALTAPVRTLGAIVMAESLGFVWAHGLNSNETSGAAYLAEGHGLAGMDDYWIMRTWTYPDLDDQLDGHKWTTGERLMRDYWEGNKSFSQLAKEPDWNLAMMWQVYLAQAATWGWTEAYSHGWTSYRNGRHVPFLPAATTAAKTVGAIP